MLAVAHPNPWSSASFYLPSQSLADSRCNLHATSRSSHSRRSPSCRFLLCRVALVCLILRRRRRLPIPCSRGFSRLSAQLCPPRGIFWPLEFIELSSRKDDSSDAHCDHLPPSHIVAQVHSLFGHFCTSTDDAGAGVPFGCIVTADDEITTGVSSSSGSSSPASSRSALRSVRSAWLTLHAVNRRFSHPWSTCLEPP